MLVIGQSPFLGIAGIAEIARHRRHRVIQDRPVIGEKQADGI